MANIRATIAALRAKAASTSFPLGLYDGLPHGTYATWNGGEKVHKDALHTRLVDHGYTCRGEGDDADVYEYSKDSRRFEFRVLNSRSTLVITAWWHEVMPR